MRTCWVSKHGYQDSQNLQYYLQCEQESLLPFLIWPFCFRHFGSTKGMLFQSMLISLPLHFKHSTRNWLVFHVFNNKENTNIWLFYPMPFRGLAIPSCHTDSSLSSDSTMRLLDMHDKLPSLSRFFCWRSLNLPTVLNNLTVIPSQSISSDPP